MKLKNLIFPPAKREESDQVIVIPCFGDTHPNSTIGLVAPGGIALDDGGWYRPSKVQLALWDAYLEYWATIKSVVKEFNARCYVAFLGDGTDDNKYSKHQLATPNEATMIKAAEAVMQPALDVADKLFYVRGTEAHTGGSGAYEELLAKIIGAKQDPVTGNYSWWWVPLDLNGTRCFFAHHPYSNSTRPWTEGGGAMRTAEMIKDDYLVSGEPVPEFAAFGHVHHYEDSGETRMVRVFFIPPWKVTGAHGHRIGYSGRTVPVGGLYFVLFPNGDWYQKKLDFTPERRQFWTDKDI